MLEALIIFERKSKRICNVLTFIFLENTFFLYKLIKNGAECSRFHSFSDASCWVFPLLQLSCEMDVTVQKGNCYTDKEHRTGAEIFKVKFFKTKCPFAEGNNILITKKLFKFK